MRFCALPAFAFFHNAVRWIVSVRWNACRPSGTPPSLCRRRIPLQIQSLTSSPTMVHIPPPSMRRRASVRPSVHGSRSRAKRRPRSCAMSVARTGSWPDVVRVSFSPLPSAVLTPPAAVCSRHPADLPLRPGGSAQYPRHRPPRAQLRGPLRHVRPQVLDQDGLHGGAADGACVRPRALSARASSCPDPARPPSARPLLFRRLIARSPPLHNRTTAAPVHSSPGCKPCTTRT